MRDLIIGVVSTLISTIFIGLWGTLMIVPYQEHRKIYKAILHLARNYEGRVAEMKSAARPFMRRPKEYVADRFWKNKRLGKEKGMAKQTLG